MMFLLRNTCFRDDQCPSIHRILSHQSIQENKSNDDEKQTKSKIKEADFLTVYNCKIVPFHPRSFNARDNLVNGASNV